MEGEALASKFIPPSAGPPAHEGHIRLCTGHVDSQQRLRSRQHAPQLAVKLVHVGGGAGDAQPRRRFVEGLGRDGRFVGHFGVPPCFRIGVMRLDGITTVIPAKAGIQSR